MNFIRDTANAYREVFLAMPVASRAIAIMLLIVIAIGLAILVRGGGPTETVYLFGGESFNEQELAEMELAFSKARLSSWTRENKRLRVPADAMHEYLRALADEGTLPSRLESAVKESLNRSNPLELSDQFKYRTQHARLQDIGRQIQMFADIKWAQVQYDRSEKGWASQHRHTASVTVMPEGDRPLSSGRERQIKELVSHSFANLRLEDVAVIDTNATRGGAGSDEDNEVLATKRRIESDMESRIRNLLSPYGDIRLLVTADLDPTLRSQTTKVSFSDRMPLDEQSRKQETETNRRPPGGVPGVQPNALAENQRISLNELPLTSKTKAEERASRGIAGQTYEQTERAPLLLRRIKVSIGLPKSYYETLYRTEFIKENPESSPQQIPPPQPEQLSKIREDVQSTIQSAVEVLLDGGEAGDDRLRMVKVWDYADLPTAPGELPPAANKAISWLAGSWQTIALGMLALVALLIARNVAKSAPAPPPASFDEGFGLEIPKPPVNEQEEEAKNSESQLQITGGSLKEELTDIIENNPDVAANVLRGWLGEAA